MIKIPPLYMALSSGERVPAFERVLEVSPGEADKLSNMMKYYKKMGYIRAHRRLYGLVKKYHHKDKVYIMSVWVCIMGVSIQCTYKYMCDVCLSHVHVYWVATPH